MNEKIRAFFYLGSFAVRNGFSMYHHYCTLRGSTLVLLANHTIYTPAASVVAFAQLYNLVFLDQVATSIQLVKIQIFKNIALFDYNVFSKWLVKS
jgi:hypothetical protein